MLPNADELAALRAWYAGLSARMAVERYLPASLGDGRSARGVLGGIRRRLSTVARQVGRLDLATLITHAERERLQKARAVGEAIEVLRHAQMPNPRISDD